MTTTDKRPNTLSRRRRLIAIAAGSVLGLTSAIAVSSAQTDAPTTACPANEADLLRAADAAQRLEVQRPDLFAQSPRPASYDDLRLAAEWASRLAVLGPSRAECNNGR